MKKISLLLLTAILVTSCVAKKDFVDLQTKHDKAKTELVDTKTNLQKCLLEIEKEAAKSFVLSEQVKSLKEDKKVALKQVENLTVLTQSSSDNIKNVISQLSEKDKYINGVRQAMTQKDSLNLAIKYHLTKNLTDGIQDKDIEVNVEKTVVFISISDKLLFRSASYNVTENAYGVLEKIAKVINAQPEMEVMIEGHTDSVGDDNYNMKLSKRRADAVVAYIKSQGVAGNRFKVEAFGETRPRFPNDTKDNQAKNRRVEIGVAANEQMIQDAKAQAE